MILLSKMFYVVRWCQQASLPDATKQPSQFPPNKQVQIIFLTSQMDVFALSTSSSSAQKLIPLGKSIPSVHSSLSPGLKKYK